MKNVPAKDFPKCLSFTKVDIKADPPRHVSSQLYVNSSGYFTDLVKDGYGQMQEQSHWCWVACAASVGSFYRKEEFGFRQEAIYEAAKGLSLGTCDGPPRSYSNNDCCNKTGYPSKALDVIKAFSREVWGEAEVSDMLSELLNNRPIVMGVKFSYGHDVDGASGHAVVLSDAVKEGTRSFWRVFDPIFGIQIVDFASFPKGYRGDPLAYWWFTDFTRKPQ